MFCVPGLISGGTEGVESSFLVLRSRTHFLRYRRRRFPFSCFALPDPFWAVPMASGPVFVFCAPGRIFSGTKGVGSRFHVLRSRTRFRRYRLCRVPFSCFALPGPFRRYRRRLVPLSCFAPPDTFLTVPKALGPVFMFCAPRLDFGGTEAVGFCFHVLRSRTHFRR
jgi:hypothetical protein